MFIDSEATDRFFANYAYFSTYKKYYYEFQTSFGEILITHKYRDIILCLAHLDDSKIIWTIKKVNSTPLLKHNLLSNIFFAKKRVEVFLQQSYILSEISHHGNLFGIANIINNKYVVYITGYFLNSILDQGIINAITLISIQI